MAETRLQQGIAYLYNKYVIMVVLSVKCLIVDMYKISLTEHIYQEMYQK
jgi:hypothetical protein